jgi:hypothetical protein
MNSCEVLTWDCEVFCWLACINVAASYATVLHLTGRCLYNIVGTARVSCRAHQHLKIPGFLRCLMLLPVAHCCLQRPGWQLAEFRLVAAHIGLQHLSKHAVCFLQRAMPGIYECCMNTASASQFCVGIASLQREGGVVVIAPPVAAGACSCLHA